VPSLRSGPAALAALERLTFVPPGECVIVAIAGPAVICENREALLVDRFEVTRSEFAAWIGARRGSATTAGELWLEPALAGELARWDPPSRDWPASFLTLGEARAFAEHRGMRLPTAREWMRVASGTRVQPWPWGQSEILSAANTLTLGLYRASPVGTFELGRTPFGTYDMLGNVWEWVEEPIDPRAADAGAAWAMGGSFASRQRRLYDTGADGRLVFHAQELDPAARSTDLGLRCVTEARAWLHAHGGLLASAPEARASLRRIGASWDVEVAPALERLALEDGAPPCIGWLLEGVRR
jgi:hypothetical protein